MKFIRARWDDRGDRPLIRVSLPARSYRPGRNLYFRLSVPEAEALARLISGRLAERDGSRADDSAAVQAGGTR